MEPTEAPVTKPINWTLAIAVTLFVVSMAIRLVGIGWGLKNDLHNQSYHPDETVIFSLSRAIEPSQGKFTPGAYSYGSLYIILLRVTSDVVTTYTGGMPDPKNQDSYWSWVSRCQLGGRVLSSICGSAMAVLCFLLLLRWMNRFGAAMGGVVLAIAPALVMHSRFETVDIMATLWIVASAYQALRLLPAEGEEPLAGKLRWRALLWAGAFAGLSAGTKYTGILALLTVYAVLALAKRPKAVIEAACATGMAILAFLVSTPGAVLDFDHFNRSLGAEMGHVATGHGYVFVGLPKGFIMHLLNLNVGLGLVLFVFSVVGCVWAVVTKQKWFWAVAAFALPYYLVIGRAEVSFMRYTFPLYFALAAGAAYAFGEAHRRGGSSKAVVAVGLVGIGGIPFGGLRAMAYTTQLMAGEDPRDQAARYLKTKGDSVHVGLVQDPGYYTPPLYPDTGMGPQYPWSLRRELMQTESHPPIAYVLDPDGNRTTPWDPRLVTKLRPEYVVYSAYEVDDLVRMQHVANLTQEQSDRTRDAKATLDELNRSYVLDRVFGAPIEKIHDWEYIQPQVHIWRRKDLP